ncbi:MAG: class I SAM-dependent methyltransferase [Acidobacteriota bacterium]
MPDRSIVVLAAKRDAATRRRHPWIFSGAVDRLEGPVPEPGATVEVRASDGTRLGVGAWSPASQIRVRLWSTDPDTTINRDFFIERLRSALALRAASLDQASAGRRLVFAESDGLPGLIVDRYADVLVCQFLAVGVERWHATIVEALAETLAERLNLRSIVERSDAEVRTKEGLEPRTGLLWGKEPPEHVEMVEGACRFLVDVRQGHKTGFYLDQRHSRAAFAAALPEGAEVLNAFSYTGAFGLAALHAGAQQVTNVDTSADVLRLGAEHARLGGFTATGDSEANGALVSVEGNVFSVLRGFRAEARRFDAIVLDPPKFADSRRKVERAARGYKDINLLAFQLLRPGGLLATFSCSGWIDTDLFQKIVAGAALDAGRTARIVERLGHPDDHPVALHFPEGRYLDGLLIRID